MSGMRLLVAGAAAAVTAAALLLGGLAARGSRAGARHRAPRRRAARRRVRGRRHGRRSSLRLQAGLRAQPRQRARARPARARLPAARTGDGRPRPTTRSREGVLRRALSLAPHDLDATSGLASLALSRHRFARCARLGRARCRSHRRPRATTASSATRSSSSAATERRSRHSTRWRGSSPGVSSYARIAYARELLGNLDGARAALLLARDAAADEPEPFAWTETQLGKLELGRGRLAPRRRTSAPPCATFPGYVYALDALAQVERRARALGRRDRASSGARSTRSRCRSSSASTATCSHATGHERAARSQYATEDGIRRLLDANGVRTDLETALFDVDHGIRLRALARAGPSRAARSAVDRRRRRARVGARPERPLRRGAALLEARPAARHAGQPRSSSTARRSSSCLGHDPRPWARRAAALNPRFSVLWTPTLRRLAS